jgi:hypothetical protein
MRPRLSTTLANDARAAHEYLNSRPGDTQALIESGVRSLPYARVDIYGPRAVLVNGVRCQGMTCALAYILARWW